MVLKAILYVMGIIGGLVLVAGPLIGSGRVAPRWTRLALWISGAAAVVWGVLGCALLFFFDDAHSLIRHFRVLSGGITIGILLLLLISGELPKLRKSRVNRQ